MDRPALPPRRARDFAPGQVLFDFTDAQSGLRALVVRGPYSFCAYVGVQADHALAGLEEFEFDCHWGITWRAWGDDAPNPAGWYWWGWAGHAGDRLAFDLQPLPPEIARQLERLLRGTKDWTVEEVALHAQDVLMQLREQLAHSAELAQLALPASQRA